jgi:hypothetical protein
MKIDITKKYCYRDGKKAQILCVDADEHGPVVSLDENHQMHRHREEGSYYCSLKQSSKDLIKVREPREWTLSVKPGTLKVSEIYEDDGPLDLHGWERVRVREIID